MPDLPADRERKRLLKRSEEAISLANKVVPKRLRKTPSQKRSEAGRKRLARGVVPETNIEKDDCRDCCRYPCGHTLNACDLRSMRDRCHRCGQLVRYRVIPDEKWEYCPVCRAIDRSKGNQP